MKATHKARLKNISDLIECLKLDTSTHIINKKYIGFLNDHEGGLLEIYKEDEIWQAGEFGFSDDMLTNIIPIKPKIGIPETPFWVEEGETAEFFEVTTSALGNGLYVDERFFLACTVMSNIENGHWIICDEQKKEMRPWTDEELIEYLMTEGWFIHEDGIKYHPMKIDDKNKAVYVAEDLIKVYATFDQIKNNYTDRHGNKFEKEV